MLHAASLKVQKAIRAKRESVDVNLKSARKFHKYFYQHFFLMTIHLVFVMTLTILFSIVCKNKVGKQAASNYTFSHLHIWTV
jgi:hypothetical protein